MSIMDLSGNLKAQVESITYSFNFILQIMEDDANKTARVLLASYPNDLPIITQMKSKCLLTQSYYLNPRTIRDIIDNPLSIEQQEFNLGYTDGFNSTFGLVQNRQLNPATYGEGYREGVNDATESARQLEAVPSSMSEEEQAILHEQASLEAAYSGNDPEFSKRYIFLGYNNGYTDQPKQVNSKNGHYITYITAYEQGVRDRLYGRPNRSMGTRKKRSKQRRNRTKKKF